ncbi:hypothetical protein BDL97_03G123200 [Sphagnum fallax]|nr:hypothetical protein BDL97_03G123200 [Sphagnum fallax]
MGTLHEVPPSYLRTAQYCIFQLSSFSLFTTQDSSSIVAYLSKHCIAVH